MKAFSDRRGKVSVVLGEVEHVITAEQARDLAEAIASAALAAKLEGNGPVAWLRADEKGHLWFSRAGAPDGFPVYKHPPGTGFAHGGGPNDCQDSGGTPIDLESDEPLRHRLGERP